MTVPWIGQTYPWWRIRKRRREQMKCQHPGLSERLIDVGAREIYWCDDCKASWML